MSRDVPSCTHWMRPRPHPSHWDSYTRALLVSKDRRHLFVTRCLQYTCKNSSLVFLKELDFIGGQRRLWKKIITKKCSCRMISIGIKMISSALQNTLFGRLRDLTAWKRCCRVAFSRENDDLCSVYQRGRSGGLDGKFRTPVQFVLYDLLPVF